MLPKNTIFCEGKIDTLILKKIWNKYLFISGGDTNLPLIVKQISEFEDNNISIKIIVDGDLQGSKYEEKIFKLNNSRIKVHKLKKGTIEDYFPSDIITEIVRDESKIELDTNLPSNFLSFVKENLNNNNVDTSEINRIISTIKNKINDRNVDIHSIKEELDNFILED